VLPATEDVISTPDDAADPSTETLPEPAARQAVGSGRKRKQRAPDVLLGRYEMIEQLGAGGMGVVYRARDRQLGRDVAIKLVLAGDDPNETLAARLLREAQALAQLSHPNVVAVYDVGRVEGGVFVAMELIAGTAGDEWLREQKRSWREVLRVFRDAARGLAAAHAVGLVHRDFKPANLILGDDGRVRVLDFGLATQVVDESAESSGPEAPTSLLDLALTQAGAIVGTPPYMAPEQHLGEPCDPRTDQFNFCAALYRALYGQRPFEGKTYGELKDNVLAGRVRPPPADAAVPGWLREIVMRGLAVEPDRRWPSMDAIIEALSRDPVARRRTLALAAAAIALVGTGAAVWYVRRDPAATCNVGTRDLAGIWDPARTHAVEEAFTQTDKPYAADAYAAVARALDGYTARWIAMRTDACVATRVRGTQSAELFDLRMDCLQRRVDSVRALVDVLASADAALVSRATEAAAGLPTLDACADVVALRAPMPRPTDPKAIRRVDEAHRALATVRALWEAGRYPEAERRLAPVVTEARALGWRPLEGEALLASARLTDSTGDYAKAAELYKEAAIAAEAGRDDETAALARNGLVWVVGERLGRYAEAREIARDAAAKIERLGRSELLQLDLDQKLATLELEQGNYEEAEQRSRHVLEVREKVLPPDDPTIAAALGDLGDVAVQTVHYDEAIDFYRRALAVAERSVGPAHPMCGTLRINLASALRGKGNNADALAELRKAREISERALGPEHSQLATIAINTGGIELDEGRPDEAAAQFRRASEIWTRALGADHPNVGTAQYRLGEVALQQGRTDEAVAAFQHALEIWEAKLGAEHPSLAAALTGLGDAARVRKRPAEALSRYTRALALLERALGDRSPALADTLLRIGAIQLELHKPRLGIAALERAVALGELGGEPIDIANARFALARALPRSDARRARSLATAARETFAGSPAHAHDAQAVTTWLQAHGGR
jgi:tetratricopeptide (TPR) repeat protein